MRKIAFTNTNLITCGGIITNYEYVSRLKKLGYEADIYAEDGNDVLGSAYRVTHRPLRDISTFDDDDIIIANRWEQCEALNQLKGKKFQFVQGDDLYLLGGSEQCKRWRNDPEWNLIGVSAYALKNWGRGEVIPNGLSDIFKVPNYQVKDIDVLVEGNNEPNKNIDEAIRIAKQIGGRIVWLGRETRAIEGVETITNPPFNEIPRIYQRAKYMIKLSKSEGFCLPILEAMASGAIVITRPMGGNDFCDYGINCLSVSEAIAEIIKTLSGEDLEDIRQNAKETAKNFSWDESTAKLVQICSR